MTRSAEKVLYLFKLENDCSEGIRKGFVENVKSVETWGTRRVSLGVTGMGIIERRYFVEKGQMWESLGHFREQ